MTTTLAGHSNEPDLVEHEPPLPLRRLLREQLHACFVRDSDLDAFCLDWFPDVYQQFSRGMSRTEKFNLLLGLEQPLADIAKAFEQERALRTQPTLALPLSTSQQAPRPRRGQQDQEIIIEDDFCELSPDKLAGWMRTIQRLVGQELKIVLRNCRAGSVILTLWGDWRALTVLMDEFCAGRLENLNGYRVLSLYWLCAPAHCSLSDVLRQCLRAQRLRCYLAIGIFQEWLSKVAATLQVPRWALAASLFFLFSGAAWATQKVVRVITQHIVSLAPADKNRAADQAPRRIIKKESARIRRSERLDTSPPDLGISKELEVTTRTDDGDDYGGLRTTEPALDFAQIYNRFKVVGEFIYAQSLALKVSEENQRREVNAQEKTSGQPNTLAEASVAGVDATLARAQTEYVNGNFNQAIREAKSVQRVKPTRAWRIIGAAACHKKDVKLASEAFQHLDSLSRQYLIYTCQRQHITTNGSQFKRNRP